MQTSSPPTYPGERISDVPLHIPNNERSAEKGNATVDRPTDSEGAAKDGNYALAQSKNFR